MSNEIFAAIERHDLSLLAALLAGGADPDAVGVKGSNWRPLHVAIEELEDGGSVEALVLLLRAGAQPDGGDLESDATPLLMALFRGQPEAVRLLLAAGADPNVVGDEGDSPLRWCVEHDDLETAALLLRCGAGRMIDQSGGPAGMSALGRAASRLNRPMIELLLLAGANPQALDVDGQTARQRMPPREESDPALWDEVAALLG